MVHQDDISGASKRTTMSVRAIVEDWTREVTAGDARKLLRVVCEVVQRQPECIESVSGINMRSWHTSAWGAWESAREHLAERPTEPDDAWLKRAQRVSLDIPTFVAELRRSNIPVPLCLGGARYREDSPAWHSPDFRRVRWWGAEYTFNEVQARAIESLWFDWE
jgi:hypothetical protein